MANETYKLIIKFKSRSENNIKRLNLFNGNKRCFCIGNVSNTIVDWSIQHKTKTSSNGCSLRYYHHFITWANRVEDTGNSSFKLKIGNGTDLWSDDLYAAGGSGSVHGDQ